MNKIVKRIFKFSARLVGLLVLAIALFIAFNLTLFKNASSAQDGFADALYLDNRAPLQDISGAVDDGLSVSLAPENTFAVADENWAQTGGKAFLIWHKGQLVHEVYADGVAPSAKSKSFSMHKSILGLVAATMEADGLISLDDPVSLYVDAYKSGGREALTIRNMLEHESGLERYSFSPPDWNALNLLLSDKIEKRALKAKRIDVDPVFDYSNINYQVAGAAVRAALAQKTSQTYNEYLSSRIWAPSGASNAQVWSETEDGAPRFYAGLHADARSWLSIGVMIAQNNGSVIPSSAIDTLLKPSGINAGYGLGVWLGSPSDGLREYGPGTPMKVPSAMPFTLSDTVFFDGFGGQRVYISQAEQLVIVRTGDVRFDWDDTALPNLAAKALSIEHSYSEADVTLMGANDRAIPVRILSRSPNCDTCTLAILSHGAFAGDKDYEAVTKPLADLGYNVAVPTHTDSKSHPLTGSFDSNKFAAYRLEDHKLILEHFSQSQSKDTQWIAVGHSFGAMIAANFGGAVADKASIDGAALGLPTHVIALSPPGDIPFAFSSDAFANLESKTLLVTGTTDIVPTMIEDWKEHLALYEGAPKGTVTAVVFEGQNHYFNGLYGRTIQRDSVDADADLIALMTAFLADISLLEGDGYSIMP